MLPAYCQSKHASTLTRGDAANAMCDRKKKERLGQRAFRHPSQIEREISWRRREQREQRRQHPEPPLGIRGGNESCVTNGEV